MPPRVFKTRTRVRYAETDAAGIAYYASFFVYFEVGRIELFRELALPYDEHLPIAETYCRYRASARFDDCLEIHSAIVEMRSKGFKLAAKVYRRDSGAGLVLLAEGYTSMVYVGDTKVPNLLPDTFRKAMAEHITTEDQL